MTIRTNRETLTIFREDGELKWTTASGDLEGYDIELTNEDRQLTVKLNGRRMHFSVDGSSFTLIGPGAYPYDYTKPSPSSPLLEGREFFGSSRGYIWQKTLPLAGDALLVGYGADTFWMLFPQYDLLGKVNYFHKNTIMVDKAHSLYLQLWLSFGGIAVALFLAMAGLFAFKALKKLRSERDRAAAWSWQQQVLTGLLGLVGAYLLAGVGNDSVIGTGVVYWALLGAGMVIAGEKGSPEGDSVL